MDFGPLSFKVWVVVVFFFKVGQGALCGLSNVLFIKSRTWMHVQFATAGVVQEACDWQLHTVGRKGDLCARAKLGSATYSSWICQNEFSSLGIKNVPGNLVWKEMRLGGRNRRSFAKVPAACREPRVPRVP